jgi:hypothetical protein
MSSVRWFTFLSLALPMLAPKTVPFDGVPFAWMVKRIEIAHGTPGSVTTTM